MDGAPSGVSDLASLTGVKDKYFGHFIALLQNEVTKFRAAHVGQAAESGQTKADEIRALLKRIRAAMPENLFNPVLQFPGKI